jgi:hypothetical protein
MGLLDGGISALFGAAFGSFYLDATLHRAAITEDGEGGGVVTFTNSDVKAQLDQVTEAQRVEEGFTDSDQRIIVLAHGVAEPTTEDEITVDGIRWQIASVKRDPAGSYYDLRGALSHREDS